MSNDSSAFSMKSRRALWFVVFAVLFSCSSLTVFAQWTDADSQAAFAAYNNAFYFSPDGEHYDYRSQQRSVNTSGFWVGAEEIELALDAYDKTPTPATADIINKLCAGFVAQFGDDWSSNSYDDDLMWATIAFVRAYKVTNNTQWLNDAETNFTTVWNRGYDTTYGGGIWWNAATKTYKASPANWTFVIAGYLLYQASDDATYRSEADTIFSWATTTLYDATTGQVYDGIGSGGLSKNNYSYNYGTAAGAFYFENHWSDANNAVSYLMSQLSSGTVGGYNILPNYGQGGTDGGGFNSIALRWTSYAYVHGAITNPQFLPWAQTNVGLGWAMRNADNLSWNNWTSSTADRGLYSWDCSNTVVGLEDVPTPSVNSDFTLSTSPDSLVLQTGATGTATVNVSPATGFSGGVALSASVVGSPTGVTASITPQMINGSGSATLTISTTSTTPGGNYVVAVTGTSNGISHTVFVRVGLPYFVLDTTSSHLYLDEGSSAAYPVEVIRRNGFNQQVQLSSPSGLPQDVQGSLVPSTTNSNLTFNLVAKGQAQTTAGVSIAVTGHSQNQTSTTPGSTVSVSAAGVKCGSGSQVNLSSSYNVTGIYPAGATYAKTGGLDGVGYSYSSQLLGTSRSLQGTLFKFGPVSKPDAIASNGQTIALPSGSYTALQLLAIAVNGTQSNQTLTVTYSDGSKSSFSQTFSDWYASPSSANEAEGVAMPYRNFADGTKNQAQINLYNYTFPLNSGKRVSSLTLPSNSNVRILAATLTRQDFGNQVDISSVANVEGIYPDDTTFSGGLDGGGAAYSANIFGDIGQAADLIVNGVGFTIESSGAVNAISGAGQNIALPAGHYSQLQMIGTGVYGPLTTQPITITYTDGTVSSFNQSFSDWLTPQGYSGEYPAVHLAYRNQSNGSKSSSSFYLYRYVWPLNLNKIPASVTLPNNQHVVALGFSLNRDYPVVGCGQ